MLITKPRTPKRPPEFPDPRWRPTSPITDEQHETLVQGWLGTINTERAARGLEPLHLFRDLEGHYRQMAHHLYSYDPATITDYEVLLNIYDEFICAFASSAPFKPNIWSESFLDPEAVAIGMGFYFDPEPGSPAIGPRAGRHFTHVFAVYYDLERPPPLIPASTED